MPETVTAYVAAQVREAERPLIEAGVPLMARAALVLARVTAGLLADASDRRVLVLAGGGDNGGDALFAAAHLLDGSMPVRADGVDVLLAASTHHEAGLAAAVAAGARVVDPGQAIAATYDFVIDGLLGTGTRGAPALRGAVRDVVTRLVLEVVAGRLRVVAVDLPSGLHPDDGTSVDGLVLPASVTVTFGGVKAGLTRARGPELAGRIVLADIGLRDALSTVVPVGRTEVGEVVDYRA
ncbi:NAD(P)H-hydrate epimerase [Microbacterium sp.]|uniref:NAD(P)H-hydrate epimerase n=1 Tax=Microbacterium sp. TaxID=51671 RepID=UPI0039E625A9